VFGVVFDGPNVLTQLFVILISCLTVEAEKRADIIAVCGLIAEPLMRYTDQITSLRMVAEKRVEKERRRTQRHSMEARRNRQDYQTLFQASQVWRTALPPIAKHPHGGAWRSVHCACARFPYLQFAASDACFY